VNFPMNLRKILLQGFKVKMNSYLEEKLRRVNTNPLS